MINKIRGWLLEFYCMFYDLLVPPPPKGTLRRLVSDHMREQIKAYEGLGKAHKDHIASMDAVMKTKDRIIELNEMCGHNLDLQLAIQSKKSQELAADLKVEEIVVDQQAEHIDQLIELGIGMRNSLSWHSQFRYHVQTEYPELYKEMRLKTDKSHGVREETTT